MPTENVFKHHSLKPLVTELLAYEQNVLRQGKLIHPGRSVSTDHPAAQFLPSLEVDCHSLVPAGNVKEILTVVKMPQLLCPHV